MYPNLILYAIYIAAYIVLQLALPNGPYVMLFKLYNFERTRISILRTHHMDLGLQVMLLSYCWTEAYGKFPGDTLGFRGWFSAQSPRGFGADITELEPITYRKREQPSVHGVLSDVNINCFIMQTHVPMFNLAWLVYSLGH